MTPDQLYPLLFSSVYKNILWGGDLMGDFLNREIPKGDVPVAESWELVDRENDQSVVENGEFKGQTLADLMAQSSSLIAGTKKRKNNKFPLLVKIIDAGKRLSLQVHPNEQACETLENAEPKTEMWYVLKAKERAMIMAGIRSDKTQIQFKSRLETDNIEEIMQTFPSREGDAYYIPAGRVHAIGAGNLILEIQQNSDTTYRVNDWGRIGQDGKPRELHIDKALQCIDFKDRGLALIRADHTFPPINKKTPLISVGTYFNVEQLKLSQDFFSHTTPETFHLIIPINKDMEIIFNHTKYFIKKGRTCLLPAALGNYKIEPKNDPLVLLRAFM